MWIAFFVGFGLLLWLLCGFISYGWIFAYFQREFPSLAETAYHRHRRYALEELLWGPIGVLATLTDPKWRKHGFKFR